MKYLLVLAVTGIMACFAAPGSAAEPNRPADANKPAARERHQRNDAHRRPQRGAVKERLQERHDEYIKWLEKNYPEEAAALAQAKDKNPDGYFQLFRASVDKYGKIAMADKDNPAMAKLLREDMDVKQQINKLVAQYKAADERDKKPIGDELQSLVAKRFDLILEQKQLRFQELTTRLENLKKEIKKQETDLGKLKERKDSEVNKRVTELLNGTPELKWD